MFTRDIIYIDFLYLVKINSEKIMEEVGLVPDLILVAPKEVAEIKFGDVAVDQGNEITPFQVKDPPTIVNWNAEPDAYYTLFFSDPDVPKNFPIKEFHHWLIVNIPGNDISKGDVIYDYLGSAPRKDSGVHRYTFLIYKQPEKLDKSSFSYLTETSLLDRGKYLLKEIVNKHQLGDPVAGNFYKAQFDDWVPRAHELIEKRYGKINITN